MNLVELFTQFRDFLSINSPQRMLEKQTFIEGRVAILQNLNLSTQELNTRIASYFEYSSQGVFNAMAFNKELDSNIKEIIVDQITNYSFIYDLKVENINYTNQNHSGIKAYFDKGHQPQIAIITIGNENKIVPFADKEELQSLLKQSAIEDCLKQFTAGKMESFVLVDNIISLSNSRDDAFKSLLESVNYNISEILGPLKQEFSLETQLDKSFRNSEKSSKLEEAIINQLKTEGTLEAYQKTRLNKNSILQDSAKQRLMVALDESSELPQSEYKTNESSGISQEDLEIVHDNSRGEVGR